jgi:hypothetical protein
MDLICRFCGRATDHALRGEATVTGPAGVVCGHYVVPVCATCWALFEETGIGAVDLRAWIVESVYQEASRVS